MIHIVFASLLMLAPPQEQGEKPTSMAPEIARSRITQVQLDDISSEERMSVLNEVIDRCTDAELRAIAHYNLSRTLIQLAEDDPAKLDEAIVALRSADLFSQSNSLRSKARFNLGHAYYKLAETPTGDVASQMTIDPQAMIDELKTRLTTLKLSASAFRSVMNIDRNNTSAAMNVERIRNEIKQLRDQIEVLEKMLEQQKEQQQQKQQQQQDAADELNELAEEQQSQADQSAESPPENLEEAEQQQGQQKELSEKTEDAQEDIAKQEGTEEIEEKIKEAQEAQERAQDAMEAGDQETAAQEQETAAKALKEAAEQMQEMADQSKEEGEEDSKDGEKSDESEGEPEPKDGQEESEEEGDEISELAKELLDKERREREQRQAYRATGRPTKVEKDW